MRDRRSDRDASKGAEDEDLLYDYYVVDSRAAWAGGLGAASVTTDGAAAAGTGTCPIVVVSAV
jgi:hypothetical protein